MAMASREGASTPRPPRGEIAPPTALTRLPLSPTQATRGRRSWPAAGSGRPTSASSTVAAGSRSRQAGGTWKCECSQLLPLLIWSFGGLVLGFVDLGSPLVRLGDAFPVSCRRVSFGGEQRPSFVPRKRTSWNRSLSIRCAYLGFLQSLYS
jgi:hypothetical protein